MIAHAILAILLASAMAATFVGRRASNAVSHGRCLVPDLGIADDGKRTGYEQAAQIAVTLLADAAEPVLAPARVLLRHKSNPGREIAPRSECLWVGDTSNQGSSQRRSYAWKRIEPPARLTGSVPSS